MYRMDDQMLEVIELFYPDVIASPLHTFYRPYLSMKLMKIKPLMDRRISLKDYTITFFKRLEVLADRNLSPVPFILLELMPGLGP